MNRPRISALIALSVLLLFLSFGARSYACTEPSFPQITSVNKGNDAKSVVIRWNFSAETFCVWPPDFYQVRWTQGEGPGTQGQSQQFKSNQATDSVSMIFDQSKLWGFIVQACKSNFAASSTCTPWSPMRYYKPYGPNECRSPYVWRNAFPNDFVCVTNQTVQETVADNAAAASRLSPDHVNCIYGFVWRGAIPSDHVCVTPSTRQEVADDNAQATARRLP